jgi:methylated-DNA-[protein]-cysteine S-methyltransferase
MAADRGPGTERVAQAARCALGQPAGPCGLQPSMHRIGEIEQTAVIMTPLGPLELFAEGESLTGIDFVSSAAIERIPWNPVLREAADQLTAYFENPHHLFSLPLKLSGTLYRQRVWRALRDIPPGQTESYGSLAKRIGGSARAIGTACRLNAFPIVIPCHRVVAAHGLGGYSGQMGGPRLDLKRWLLKHEGCRID